MAILAFDTPKGAALALLGAAILTGATATVNSPLINVAQTWNNAGATFTGLKFNFIRSAYNTNSLLLDIQADGSSAASVKHDGTITGIQLVSTNSVFARNNNGQLCMGAGDDVRLNRDGANILALRNGVTAQTFRLYNTYTDSSNGNWLEQGVAGSEYRIFSNGNGTGATALPVSIQGGVAGGGQVRANPSGTIDFIKNGTSIRWTIDASGHFTASTDNTYDIGASGATRPRNIYAAGTIVIGTTGALQWPARLDVTSPAGGNMLLRDSTGTTFNLLQFGGTTSSFPALKRNGANLQVRLADDSNYSTIQVSTYFGPNSSRFYDTADGLWVLSNSTNTALTGLLLGPSGTAYVRLKPDGAGSLQIRLADDSANAGLGVNALSAGTTSLGTLTSGAHTITNGTIVSSLPLIDASQTWNNVATTFTAIKLNVTDTASAAASLLFDGQINGVSAFKVYKDGGISIASSSATSSLGGTINLPRDSASLAMGAALDIKLTRDAAGTLAQRNGTNAQTFNVYNTYTDASNYERLVFDWTTIANTATIKTANAGTGSTRALQVFAAGQLSLGGGNATQWNINSSGHFIATTDNTVDIGASGANRPRAIYAATAIVSSGSVTTGNTSGLNFGTRGSINAANGDGIFTLFDNAATSFGRLQFGGTTSSFPAIKRSGAQLQFRLADDTAYASIRAGAYYNANGTVIVDSADGVLQFTNGASTTFTGLLLGPSGTNYVRLRTLGSGALQVRLADDSNFANIEALAHVSTGGTVTVSAPVFDGTQTWNNVATTFTAIKLNVTDTASATNSNLMDLQVGGATKAWINKFGDILSARHIYASNSGYFGWNGRANVASPTSSNITLLDNPQTSFGLLQFGGTTSSFPAIKRSATAIEFRLADDTAFASIRANTVNVASGTVFSDTADGIARLTNNSGSGFTGLLLGPSGTSYARLSPTGSAGELQVALADGSAISGLVSASVRSPANLTAAGQTLTSPSLSSAGTSRQFQVYTGTGSTWVLPTIASSSGVAYYIKNRGSGNLTINSNAGGNDIYSTSAVNTLVIAAGGFAILQNDGTYFNVQ